MQLDETGRSVIYGRKTEDGREQRIHIEVMSEYGRDVVVIALEVLDEALGMGGWTLDAGQISVRPPDQPS